MTQEGDKDNSTYFPAPANPSFFMSLTAGAGTRCMSLLSSSPSLRPAGLKERLGKRGLMREQDVDVGTCFLGLTVLSFHFMGLYSR